LGCARVRAKPSLQLARSLTSAKPCRCALSRPPRRSRARLPARAAQVWNEVLALARQPGVLDLVRAPTTHAHAPESPRTTLAFALR
jgi:hypothetical protein